MAVISTACTECSIYDILTVQRLKDTTLAGVDLTDDDNNPLPDIMFEQAIRSAVQMLEADIGIQVERFSFKGERKDSMVGEGPWWFTRLNRRQVISVDRFQMRYGNFDPIDVPISWINLIKPLTGQLNIVPSQESLGSFLFYREGALIFAGWGLHGYPMVPGYFSFDYTAGFDCRCGTVTIPNTENGFVVEFPTPVLDKYNVTLSIDTANGAAEARVISKSNDGMTIIVNTPPSTGDAVISYTLTTMPDSFLQAASIVAAMTPLDTAGDLIMGAGIASTSISVDALQQTINSTASPTNSGYGARILSQRRQLKELVASLKARYRVMQLGYV